MEKQVQSHVGIFSPCLESLFLSGWHLINSVY